MIKIEENKEELKKVAYISIISFGLISLFGDIIYEGARSIVPTYLKLLGASAVIVGTVIGLGEFLGYALRLLSGYVADVKKSYWPFVFVGYGLLVVIPLLALTMDWRLAVILILLERIAKAMRSPARDTLLSVTTKGVGTGKAFGFHELMDQIGAVTGPAIVTLILFYTGDIKLAFLTLGIPYLILVSVLLLGYKRMSPFTKRALESIERKSKVEEKLTSTFYLYSLAVFLNTAGLIHMALILYIATAVFPKDLEYLIPVVFLVIQLVDAVMALIAGYSYDKIGRTFLIFPFILSIFPTIFALQFSIQSIWIAAAIFGLVFGMQESVYRAAVADITGISKRGTAYGIFNTLYGLGFLVSGYIFGYFIDLIEANVISVEIAILYSVAMQIVAMAFLILSIKLAKQSQ